MAKYCLTEGCKNGEKTFQNHVLKCGACGKALSDTKDAKPVETAQERFISLLAVVKGKLSKNDKNHTEYVKPMLEYLPSCDSFFQTDFTREMYSPTTDDKVNAVNLGLLLEAATKRSQDFGKSCVDQALTALSSKFTAPAGCPAGEKFIFEIPYILKSKWAFLNTGSVFTQTVKTFLGTVKAGTSYLLLYKLDANPIAHAVFITVNAKGTPYLFDTQKNDGKVGPYKYIAWSIDGAAAIGKTYQELDAETGNIKT